jgi:hypothetical protein
MYWYLLYGLRLQTNRPLPGLLPIPESEVADWTIYIAGTETLPGGWHSNLWEDIAFHATNQVILSTHEGEGETVHWFHFGHEDNLVDVFMAVANRQIWVCWQHEVPESIILESLSDLLSQIVLSYLLRMEGCFVLHAAAVTVDEKSFLLIAKSGTGKSSLTLALAAAGLLVLSEETAVLQASDEGFWVQPGATRLRLWSTTLEAMAIPPEELTLVPPHKQKRYLPLSLEGQQQPAGPYQYAGAPARLSCIYWIEGRDAMLTVPLIDSMKPSAGTTMLLNNRYHPFPVGPAQVAHELRSAARLAQDTPIRRVQLPDRLDRLEQTAAAILEDFHRQTRGEDHFSFRQ